MKISISKTCLFLTIVFFPWQKNLAQVFEYDSLYQPKPGIVGKAQFSYSKRNNENIINGEFKFIREEKDSVIENIAIHQSWTGKYRNNIKDGLWEYRSKNHKVKINEISQIELDYDIISKDELLEINYANGIPDNDIKLKSELYINNNKIRVLEEFSTSFSKRMVSGEFVYLLFTEDEERVYAVEGEAHNGLMEGKWVFEYFQDNLREERNYKKGILLNLKKWKNHELIVDLEFPLSQQLQEAVDGEASGQSLVNKPLSLTFSDGYPRNSVYILEQEKGSEILEGIFNKVFQYDDHLDMTEQLSLGTNRGYYPLSKEEEKNFDAWTETEALYREKTQEIKDMEIDNLSSVKDSTIQVVINWAEKQLAIQDYIKPWNNIFSKEQIAFYNRKGLLNQYAEDLLSHDTISANNEEIVFTYEAGSSNNFLQYITNNMRERIKVADSLTQRFEDKLEELSLNNQITNINETISERKKHVDSLYLLSTEDRRIAEILEDVKANYLEQQYPEELKEFLSEESPNEQINIGNQILANLQILEEIHKTGHQISESRDIIDELYTIHTFDPFTFSDEVPTRVKKRLYEIVTEEMIGFVLNERIKTDTQPAQVLKELNLAKRLQERLVFLRDVDTDRLTRRLRRNKSFEERVDLLNNF